MFGCPYPGDGVAPGSQTFTAAGTFTVPNFNTISFRLVGGGGGGGGSAFVTGSVPFTILNGSTGTAGGNTAIPELSLLANGGQPGTGGTLTVGLGGDGGAASGGDTNTAGQDGEDSATAASNPQLGGSTTNNGPGAGGNGGNTGPGGPGNVHNGGGGGGEGGRCFKEYTIGQLAVGAILTMTVGLKGNLGAGASGAPSGQNGVDGLIEVIWS